MKLVALRLYRSTHNLEVFQLLNNYGILPMSHPIIGLAAKLAYVLELFSDVSVRESNKTGANLIWKCQNEFTRMVRLE